jgi:hypothetical protein
MGADHLPKCSRVNLADYRQFRDTRRNKLGVHRAKDIDRCRRGVVAVGVS